MHALLRIINEHRESLPMFVIYDHPKDYPDTFVARMWTSLPAPKPLAFTIQCAEIEPLWDVLESAGLVKLARNKGDDPSVMEVWL